MKKISALGLLLSFLLCSACKNQSQNNTQAVTGAQDDTFEYFVARATKENPRNSEADIIHLKDGALLLGWTEFYAADAADHGPARIVGKISKDGGRSWGNKYTLVENNGGRNVMEVNFLRLKNDDIALFYGQKNTESTDCRIMMRTSSDEGKTWNNEKQLSLSGRYTGLTNGRALRLGSGRILLEVWYDGYNYCLISDDEGETWRDSQYIKPGGDSYENACIELKSGDIMMLMRTSLGSQYKSISTDGGETWSEPIATPLVGTAAPVSLCRIPETEDILAIWNNNPGARSRSPLTSAISRDEGETWEHFKNIEEGNEDAWAYPAVTWVDNRALITYFNYKDGLSLKIKGLPADWFYE